MQKFSVSFFCYYGPSNHTCHRQDLSLDMIPTWIAAYRFTHPGCTDISVKITFPCEDIDYSRFLY